MSLDGDRITGICAVLGTDIVAFSTLPDEDQFMADELLSEWTRAALHYHEVAEKDYRWSSAGDGGYLTFKTFSTSDKALDIGFSILEKAQHSIWIPRTGNRIELRFGLHAGPVYESYELAGGTNIRGDGINMAARVLSVASNSQALVSNQYYDTYIHNRKEKDFEFGDPFPTTDKHGVRVFVRNCRRGDLGLQRNGPAKSVSNYDFFIAYASPDRRQAENLSWFLQDESCAVFLDVECLAPGASWPHALREALEASRVIVVLVSAHTDHAFYQQEEIVRAIQFARDKPGAYTVIPVMLGKLPKGAMDMPYGMSSLQALDATRSGGLKRVADELAAWLKAHKLAVE